MEAICQENHRFPQEYVDRARALLGKWQGENWGAPVAVKRDSARESESDDEKMGEIRGKKRKKEKSSMQRPALYCCFRSLSTVFRK